MSRRYLDGVLLERTGETLAARLRRRRLELAAEAIAADPEEPVGRIGARFGCRDPSHFTRAFQRWFGCTPAAWRRR